MTDKIEISIYTIGVIQENKIRPIFFFALLGAMTLLLSVIFLPFLSPLALAASLALIFRPIHKRILNLIGNYPSIASFLTLLLIFLIVIIPLTLLAGQLFIEARTFYINFSETSIGQNPLADTLNNLNASLSELVPFLSLDLARAQTEIVNWLINNLNFLFAGALQAGLNIFVFFFALFYLIRDGEKLKNILLKASPLTNKDDIKIFSKLRQATNSVFLGSLLIALVQGILAAVGLIFFNIPQPFLWGALGAIASLIPGIGASLIFIPIILIKLGLGEFIPALGLTIWAIIVVGGIDNIIRPYFIKRGINVHPFMILISVLGGILVFGPIGFILGPIILTLFFSLFDMYLELVKTDSTL